MNSRTILSGVAVVALAGLIVAGSAGTLGAQVAGSTTVGVSVEELKMVAAGWSAKKKILGKAVYNDKNEKIGVVDDLIVTPDKSISYAIIGAGGFLGMGKHDVAIPVGQFKEEKDESSWPGRPRMRSRRCLSSSTRSNDRWAGVFPGVEETTSCRDCWHSRRSALR